MRHTNRPQYREYPRIAFPAAAREVWSEIAIAPTLARKVSGDHSKQIMEFAGGLCDRERTNLSMAAGYVAPGWGPSHPLFADFKAVLERLFEPNSSLPVNGNIIPSNFDIYENYIATREGYTVRIAEDAIVNNPDFLEVQREDFTGCDVLILCCGSGTRETQIIKNIGGNVGRVFVNDIVPKNTADTKAKLIKAGVPAENIITNNDDIFSDQFRDNPDLKTFRRQSKKMVIVALGATPGNFSASQRKSYATFLHDFMRDGDIYWEGAQKTSHLPTVRRAYDNYYYSLFSMKAFLWFMSLTGNIREFGFGNIIDFNKIDCVRDFHITNKLITMETSIVNTAEQVVHFREIFGGDVILPKGKLPVIYIGIANEASYRATMMDNGLAPLEHLRFTPPREKPQLREVVHEIGRYQRTAVRSQPSFG